MLLTTPAKQPSIGVQCGGTSRLPRYCLRKVLVLMPQTSTDIRSGFRFQLLPTDSLFQVLMNLHFILICMKMYVCLQIYYHSDRNHSLLVWPTIEFQNICVKLTQIRMWKMFSFVNIPFYFVVLSWIPFGLKFCSLHVCLLIHCHSDSNHSILGCDLQFNFKIFVSSRLSGYNLDKNVEAILLWKHQLSSVIILWIPSVV